MEVLILARTSTGDRIKDTRHGESVDNHHRDWWEDVRPDVIQSTCKVWKTIWAPQLFSLFVCFWNCYPVGRGRRRGRIFVKVWYLLW